MTNVHSVGAWFQSVGWENMAFVFLNHYLDLSEVCDDVIVAIGDQLSYSLIFSLIFIV